MKTGIRFVLHEKDQPLRRLLDGKWIAPV